MTSKAKDVARLAGVSTATVCRVVNESNNVSAETRTRVLNAISQLQYRKNIYAAQLGRINGGRTKSLNGKNRELSATVSAGKAAKEVPIRNQRADIPQEKQKIRRLNVLQIKYSRMIRAVNELGGELDKLRNII